jgi:hypothetical protein
MPGFLRQSTVATVKLGPFLSPTDGLTPYTTAGFTVKLGANGGALAARNDSTAITHDADGYFFVELNATDTGALDRLKLDVPGSAGNYLPVWDEFVVLAPAVYDVLFGTTAPSTHTAAAVAALVLATPAHPVATDASGFVTATNGGGGSILSGLVAAGSTANMVVVTGYPAGKQYAGQRLQHGPSGECRYIQAQEDATIDYVFTLGAGTYGAGTGEDRDLSADPTAGDAVTIIP